MMEIQVKFSCDQCNAPETKMVEVAIHDGHLSPWPILAFQMPDGWERFFDPTCQQSLMRCRGCAAREKGWR